MERRLFYEEKFQKNDQNIQLPECTARPDIITDSDGDAVQKPEWCQKPEWPDNAEEIQRPECAHKPERPEKTAEPEGDQKVEDEITEDTMSEASTTDNTQEIQNSEEVNADDKAEGVKPAKNKKNKSKKKLIKTAVGKNKRIILSMNNVTYGKDAELTVSDSDGDDKIDCQEDIRIHWSDMGNMISQEKRPENDSSTDRQRVPMPENGNNQENWWAPVPYDNNQGNRYPSDDNGYGKRQNNMPH